MQGNGLSWKRLFSPYRNYALGIPAHELGLGNFQVENLGLLLNGRTLFGLRILWLPDNAVLSGFGGIRGSPCIYSGLRSNALEVLREEEIHKRGN